MLPVGRLDGDELLDELDQSYSSFISYFGYLVSQFPLTYRSELIDEYSALGAKRLV